MLEVRGLSAGFGNKDALITAVDRLSFSLKQGHTLCVVGESGCGKTTALLSLMGLSQGQTDGEVIFKGRNLLALPRKELRRIWGKELSVIFQEPQTALNPVLTVGTTLCHLIRAHQPLSRAQAEQRAVELMARVGLPDPAALIRRYPHELSGGMRQRVLIAGALANEPDLVLADEPTSALDVTIRAQIIALFAALRAERSCSFLIATHDLTLVRRLADEILVMYAGQMVEYGSAKEILARPEHPYTAALLAADREDGAAPLGGEPPSPAAFPAGCRFHPRCPAACSACAREEPPLSPRRTGGGLVRCQKG